VAKPFDARKLGNARFERLDIVLVLVVKDGLEVLAECRGINCVSKTNKGMEGVPSAYCPGPQKRSTYMILPSRAFVIGRTMFAHPAAYYAHGRVGVKKRNISHIISVTGGSNYRDSKKCLNQTRSKCRRGFAVRVGLYLGYVGLPSGFEADKRRVGPAGRKRLEYRRDYGPLSACGDGSRYTRWHIVVSTSAEHSPVLALFYAAPLLEEKIDACVRALISD
jgi:hypothetical protein